MDVIHTVTRAWSVLPRPRRRECVLCGQRIGKFLSYRGGFKSLPPLMQSLEIIGSDVDNFECPRCGAHDRERHLLLYLQASGIMGRVGGMRILHFAPERHLSERIAAQSPLAHVRCDLFPTSSDIRKADIEAMPFDDGTFDLVIANHVLEHVDNDLRAVREIHRVLSTEGLAILQTPYSPMLHTTWQDPGIIEAAARLQSYGQEDHVRLFGRDIFERFASAGLTPQIATHSELLPDIDARRFGINPREPFFLFRRAA